MDTRMMLQAIQEERSRDAARVARLAASRSAPLRADAARTRFAVAQAPLRWLAQGASSVAHAAKLSRASRAPLADR